MDRGSALHGLMVLSCQPPSPCSRAPKSPRENHPKRALSKRHSGLTPSTALSDAQAGVINPYGPTIDAPLDVRALGHDIGYTQGSGLTSWTADQAWALARQQRLGGIVVETVAPEGSVWFNQAAKGAESQVLIPGPIKVP
jgi:hypothetical protein